MALNIDRAKVIIFPIKNGGKDGFDGVVRFLNPTDQIVHERPIKYLQPVKADKDLDSAFICNIIMQTLPELPHNAEVCTLCFVPKRQEQMTIEGTVYDVEL